MIQLSLDDFDVMERNISYIRSNGITRGLYSEDFDSFMDIVGDVNAFVFVKMYAPIEITFPRLKDAKSTEKYKHAKKVRCFFGDGLYLELCKLFGGAGRVKFPTCALTETHIRRVEIEREMKKLENDAIANIEKETAKKYGMTYKNIQCLKKKLRMNSTMSVHHG